VASFPRHPELDNSTEWLQETAAKLTADVKRRTERNMTREAQVARLNQIGRELKRRG